MEIRHLKMLHTLLQTGSLSSAAALLGTSQPRLTQQLRHVEDELGTVLFHRSARGLTLSEAGQSFLPYAKKSIACSSRRMPKCWD
jgi:DNA-binding transcriptional LysR family regulator